MIRKQMLILLVVAASVTTCYAESTYLRELRQLVEQRDTARAAAAVPIDAKFKADAEQLLRRAIQAGNLDAANKIKAAIENPLPGETTNDPRELKQLMEQRGKAHTAASAPINAKFKAAAEQLRRRATQAGDLEAANKINAAIVNMLPPEVPKTSADLKKQLMRTKWKVDTKSAKRPGLPETLTFTEKTIEPSGHRYEIDSHNTLTVTFPKGDKQSMTLTKDGKRLEFSFRAKEHAYELVTE